VLYLLFCGETRGRSARFCRFGWVPLLARVHSRNRIHFQWVLQGCGRWRIENSRSIPPAARGDEVEEEDDDDTDTDTDEDSDDSAATVPIRYSDRTATYYERLLVNTTGYISSILQAFVDRYETCLEQAVEDREMIEVVLKLDEVLCRVALHEVRSKPKKRHLNLPKKKG
jgi:hypothetical protein